MKPGESFVGQPIRSLQTMLRVLAEHDNSYLSVIPDGIYGANTSAAVSNFQKKHGLNVTGITDQLTWEHIVQIYRAAHVNISPAQKIEVILNPGEVIHLNEENPHIYLVQGMLTVISDVYLSVSRPSHTGILDLPTSQSLALFQSLSGLPMTGELDKQTWEHLSLQYPLAANLKLTPIGSSEKKY